MKGLIWVAGSVLAAGIGGAQAGDLYGGASPMSGADLQGATGMAAFASSESHAHNFNATLQANAQGIGVEGAGACTTCTATNTNHTSQTSTSSSSASATNFSTFSGNTVQITFSSDGGMLD